jgi:hypothetical protein
MKSDLGVVEYTEGGAYQLLVEVNGGSFQVLQGCFVYDHLKKYKYQPELLADSGKSLH